MDSELLGRLGAIGLNVVWQCTLFWAAVWASSRLVDRGRQIRRRSLTLGFALLALWPLWQFAKSFRATSPSASSALSARDGLALSAAFALPVGALVAALLLLGLLRLGLLLAAVPGLIALASRASRLPAEFQESFERLTREPGSRSAEVRISAEISTPCTAGLIRPVVLLPGSALTTLTRDELDGVIIHELCHIRRWDDWKNLIEKATARLFFFVPGVRWVTRQLEVERELRCDAEVISCTGQKAAYARTLVRFAELRDRSRSALAVAMVTNSGDLAIRIEAMLAPSTGTRPKALPIALSGTTLPVALAGVILLPSLYFAIPSPLMLTGEAAKPPFSQIENGLPAIPDGVVSAQMVDAPRSVEPGSVEIRAGNADGVERIEIPEAAIPVRLAAACYECRAERTGRMIEKIRNPTRRSPRGRTEPLPPIGGSWAQNQGVGAGIVFGNRSPILLENPGTTIRTGPDGRTFPAGRQLRVGIAGRSW